MITPNKSIPLKDSIIFKMLSILEKNFETMTLIELYQNTKSELIEIDEFIYSIDALYVLGKIELNIEQGIIKKC
ncbi:ABC-three component system middle component 7 [Aeromonas enteropelogenes]|uniref:ABC-three component system middle component 7 n=1 Tax=Aeromonas enteropelogenes TaxID=29489 RepID=A0ABU9JAJ6_AEREN